MLPERLLLAGGGAALRFVLTASGLVPPIADRYVARLRQPGVLTAALNWYRAAGQFVELDDVPHWIPEQEPVRTAELLASHAACNW